MRVISVSCVLSALALVASCGACGGTTGSTGTGEGTAAGDPTAVFEHDGEITDRSERVGTGLGQTFQVPIASAGSYAVTLSSSAFDPLLVVTTPEGAALSNDDWQGSREHAQLQLTVAAPGQLRISATSNDGRGTGRYRLLVRRADGGVAADVPHVAGGGTYDGVVEGSDPALPDGRRYDTVLVDGPGDVRVTSTGGVAAAVAVIGPTGAPVLAGQDGAYRIVQAGTHRVQLTAATVAGGARYHVEVGARPTAMQAAMPTLGRNHHELPREGGGTPIVFEQTTRGALAENDPRLPTGEVADVYQLTLAAGVPLLSVDLRSTAFDPYLMVVGPDGQTHENDDFAGALNSRVEIQTPTPGLYRVVATAYRGHERGAYEVEVARGAGAAPPPTNGGGGDVAGTQMTGDSVQGSLAAGDEQLQSGEFFDRHLMAFTSGEAVNLRLESRTFDTYMIVRTPGGQQHDNDDFSSQTGTNSGVDIPAAEAGQYTVMVTSYRPGETGAYTLRRERGAAVPRPNQPNGEGGRIFGIFAGISDYPGSGDLPECANDALKLAETLRNAGLLAPERQVVLTDGQATTANIRSAMQRMARDVGPDDVFVFFYSGHGGQQPGQQDARELDGQDETLALYDGAMVDDELGTLFDGLRARVAIAALDSCHSGGFDKDIITRPGRVGLFSSEEDVLSAVAAQFQAGGYLSHFLRLAIAGDADMNPHDRVLTVGELTHHLYTQFGSHASDIQLAAAYQHLVVDRGAVGVDQVLWSYR